MARRAHYLTSRSYCRRHRRGRRDRAKRGPESTVALGLDLTSDEGLEILCRLAATCDVFLTNKLPGVRSKLRIDVDDIRAHSPQIVYVRGTGQGERGPDADRGSYDSLAYWCRSGIAVGMKQPEYDYVPAPPAPAFGDSIGAMTIGPGVCAVIGRPELATDERFADAESIRENVADATQVLREAFAQRDASEWRERLSGFSGQWAMVQDTLEASTDPQTVANGYVQDCETAEGVPFQLAAAPIQYDERPAAPRRAPAFNEHGDAILEGLGLDRDAIVDLKVRGVVA